MSKIDPEFEVRSLFQCEAGQLVYYLLYNGSGPRAHSLGIVLERQSDSIVLLKLQPALQIESITSGDYQAVIWKEADLQVHLDGMSAVYSDNIMMREGVAVVRGSDCFLKFGSTSVDLRTWVRTIQRSVDPESVAFSNWTISVRKPGTQNERHTLISHKATSYGEWVG